MFNVFGFSFALVLVTVFFMSSFTSFNYYFILISSVETASFSNFPFGSRTQLYRVGYGCVLYVGQISIFQECFHSRAFRVEVGAHGHHQWCCVSGLMPNVSLFVCLFICSKLCFIFIDMKNMDAF